jgi:hypothetical protein
VSDDQDVVSALSDPVRDDVCGTQIALGYRFLGRDDPAGLDESRTDEELGAIGSFGAGHSWTQVNEADEIVERALGVHRRRIRCPGLGCQEEYET